MSEFKATGKYIGISPKKTRIPAKIVKGVGVEDALGTLQYMTKGTALHVAKVIKSAAANAMDREGLKPSELVIKDIKIDRAPGSRRGYFTGKGGYKTYYRHYSHITVVVSDNNVRKTTKVSKTKNATKNEVNKAEVVDAEIVSEKKTVKSKTTKKSSAKSSDKKIK